MRAADEIERDALDYIDGVLAGRVIVGRYVRLAVERHVRDLKRGAARGLRFNRLRALRALWWAENRCRFSKGQWAGRPFRHTPFQAFKTYSLFGWERAVDGEWQRRWRTAYVREARKNGKTEWAAVIALIFLKLVGEAEAGGEVYFAATKKDQAAIGWRAAAGMVKRSPLLRKEIKVNESRYNLADFATESKLEAVASDADTLDGLGPLCAIVDEYHAHPDSDVADVLESGMGARREPLMLFITTAGEKRQGACWDLEADALRVLEGIGENEGAGDDLFVFIAQIDDGDDWSNEAVWPKANPNLGVSCFPDKLRIAAKVAKRRPAALHEFLRKHMNLWTETSTAWLPMPDWDACTGLAATATPDELHAYRKATRERLRGRKCFVGIDLSAVADYTAGVAVFPPEEEGGAYEVFGDYWIPAETLIDRGRTDRVPVTQWVQQGLVTATSGPVVDQDAVKEWLLNLRERYGVVEVPMDPHNATKLQSELMGAGFTVVNMRQGWVTMSPAIKDTEILIRQRKIHHGGDPVLRWMFSNVALKRDSNDNLSLDKGRSGDRIDGIVGLVMGVGRARAQPVKKVSKYERGDLRSYR